MERIGECRILTRIFSECPPCLATCSKLRIFSHISEGIGEGCLIAHTVLAVIEAERIRNVFQEPLYRVFNPRKLTADQLWEAMLSAILIHDLGKLTENYQSPRYKWIRHNRVSAAIAKRSLGKLFGSEIGLKLAYGILLHHEAFEWKALEDSLKLNIIIESPSFEKYTISEEKLKFFQEGLEKCLEKTYSDGILNSAYRRTLSDILINALDELRESSGKGLRLADILEIQRFFRNFKCIDYQGPAMIAYRIIYIADNRAASARERYWLDRISECRWNTLDSIAIEIKKMLPKRHHMIALSSLPREHSQL